jgi:hypothetical protein
MPRKLTSTNPRNLRNHARYWSLKNAGASIQAAKSAYGNPARYAAAMLELGAEPIPDLSVFIHGGKPRLSTPKALIAKARYHDLRKRGCLAVFASEYCKSPIKHARALRILAGEESE